MASVHLKITGTVQGVYYRASAAEKAAELHIKGWVKNKADGSVEAVACGLDKDVKAFETWCRKGPAGARVTDVIVTPQLEDTFTSFEILR